ncbi:hypothetical protein BS47DRAFT_1362051 [Hydnum rufescens UP504]|uniref:Uncharacterized protein n=1 Tax=Hydnum rufescens UP504 TaxID=1448309 RepID=A0A9P6AYZ9_9AGAM|nr:hypothetical protein BS47DRAFT_1362051 [Hydnum rufescens UP504]
MGITDAHEVFTSLKITIVVMSKTLPSITYNPTHLPSLEDRWERLMGRDASYESLLHEAGNEAAVLPWVLTKHAIRSHASMVLHWVNDLKAIIQMGCLRKRAEGVIFMRWSSQWTWKQTLRVFASLPFLQQFLMGFIKEMTDQFTRKWTPNGVCVLCLKWAAPSAFDPDEILRHGKACVFGGEGRANEIWRDIQLVSSSTSLDVVKCKGQLQDYGRKNRYGVAIFGRRWGKTFSIGCGLQVFKMASGWVLEEIDNGDSAWWERFRDHISGNQTIDGVRYQVVDRTLQPGGEVLWFRWPLDSYNKRVLESRPNVRNRIDILWACWNLMRLEVVWARPGEVAEFACCSLCALITITDALFIRHPYSALRKENLDGWVSIPPAHLKGCRWADGRQRVGASAWYSLDASAFSLLKSRRAGGVQPSGGSDGDNNNDEDTRISEDGRCIHPDIPIPLRTADFQRYSNRAGPTLWLVKRIKEVLLWREGWKYTATFISAYAAISLPSHDLAIDGDTYIYSGSLKFLFGSRISRAYKTS